MLSERMSAVRTCAPLVHAITNYVTANDCANILLACGGSPIMADDPREAAEMARLSQAVTLNIGTLNESTLSAMSIAGQAANECGHPVVLDPVGIGASRLRTDAAFHLLDTVYMTVIRGNASEIKCLARTHGTVRGVDADALDAVTEERLPEIMDFVRAFARKTGSVIAMTGAIDMVSDAAHTYIIRNGTALMSRVTGTGCMLSAMTAAYLAANPDDPCAATAASVIAMGIAGQRAERRMTALDGNSSFRHYLIDAIFRMDALTFEAEAQYDFD